MTIHRFTARRNLIVLVIALTVCLFFARAFGSPAQYSTTDKGVVSNDPSTPSRKSGSDVGLVADLVASLRQIHVESTDPDIPLAAKPLLTELKHRLRDLIGNRLRSETKDASTTQLQATVIEDLRRSGVIITEPLCVVVDKDYVDTGYDYGDIDDITIKRPQYCDCNDLIAVTTTIGVLCGQDSSLYIFKYKDQNWKLILASEANDYDKIHGAQGGFEYGVSWPDDSGNVFVVTASVTPWCTSNWQRITYRVLRPGAAPDEPREVLSRTETIWLGDDPPYSLDMHYDRFTLRFFGQKYEEMVARGDEMDSDDSKGMSIIKYKFVGDSLKRND